MAEQRKLSAAEQRLFLRMRSEQLRIEAIEATGDPQARASQAPSMKGVMEDQLPGGEHEADGKATLDLALGKHVNKAQGDPQKPASQTNRIANQREDLTNNVNLQEKADIPEETAPEPAPVVATKAPAKSAPKAAPVTPAATPGSKAE